MDLDVIITSVFTKLQPEEDNMSVSMSADGTSYYYPDPNNPGQNITVYFTNPLGYTNLARIRADQMAADSENTLAVQHYTEALALATYNAKEGWKYTIPTKPQRKFVPDPNPTTGVSNEVYIDYNPPLPNFVPPVIPPPSPGLVTDDAAALMKSGDPVMSYLQKISNQMDLVLEKLNK